MIQKNWLKTRTQELEKAYNSLKESEKGLAEAQKMAHIRELGMGYCSR
jgi:hypothetical protein